LKKFILIIYLLFLLPDCVFAQPGLIKKMDIYGNNFSKIYASAYWDNKLWIATDKGVFIKADNSNKFLKKNTRLPEITGFFVDESKRLWMYNLEGDFILLKQNSQTEIRIGNKIRDHFDLQIVNSMAVDKSNNMWLNPLINGGLIKVENLQYVQKINPTEIPENAFFINEIEEENFVWGSYKNYQNAGLLHVNFINQKPISIKLSGVLSQQKTVFHKLFNAEYLFAKNQEIIHINRRGIIARAFVDKSIECIFEDSEGKIWVGLYNGGVTSFPNGNLASGKISSFMNDITVINIHEDNKGNLWFISADNGIYKMDAPSIFEYTPPKIFSKQEVKSSKKPLIGEELTIDLKKNELKNLMVDTLVNDSLAKIPPKIYLTGVKITEKDTIAGNDYDLAYHQNYLKFSFNGIGYSGKEKIQYRYHLQGYDKEWNYSDNNFANYSMLPPGKYVFEAEAMNKFGVWSQEPITINIKINKPYWQQWWFIVSVLGFIITIVLLLAYFRIKQIEKREEEKTRLSKKIADLELGALRAQMNPHFIFNTLSSIQQYILSNNTEQANFYLSKFAKLMRSIVQNSQKPFISIKEEVETLKLYCQLERLRASDKFEFEILVDEKLDLLNDQIPPMLIQPYVENAIRHGVSPLEKDGLISIHIKKQDEYIVCSILDNGVGREKSKELNKERVKTHQSLGMIITRERLEILNKMSNSNLNVSISDLFENEEACGTKVEIFVPLN